MPWKLNEHKAIAVDEKGNPIWVTDSGDERPVDYTAMSTGLSTANREAAERKAKIKEMEARYGPLAEIEDLSAFLKQAEADRKLVESMPDKDKVVEDRIKAQVEAATKPLNDKLAKIQAERDAAAAKLQQETISSAFFRSKFVSEKIHAEARTIAADLFSRHFSFDNDGKLVATGTDGQIIYGENGPASFDEALARLVENHPSKGILLAGSPSNGGGATGGGQRNTTVNPWKKETRNVTEQMRLIKENLELARSMAKEAGSVLPI